MKSANCNGGRGNTVYVFNRSFSGRMVHGSTRSFDDSNSFGFGSCRCRVVQVELLLLQCSVVVRVRRDAYYLSVGIVSSCVLCCSRYK